MSAHYALGIRQLRYFLVVVHQVTTTVSPDDKRTTLYRYRYCAYHPLSLQTLKRWGVVFMRRRGDTWQMDEVSQDIYEAASEWRWVRR